MKKGCFCILVVLYSTVVFGAEQLVVEAEGFENVGGWVVDQQFMDVMGSPFLLAHGLGEPVADAVTTVTLPATGRYRVWVRTRDWVGPWDAPGAPGRFQVIIDGRPVETIFGAEGADWHWQDGGTVEISKKKVAVALHDLTGFEGRCDAIVFSSDLDFEPPNEGQRMQEFRRKMLGLADKPEDVGTFDLVVVGGGMAGACASLSAARLGVKVALIQNRPVLGGNNSSEVRVHLMGETGFEPYPRIGDIVREIGPRQDMGNRAEGRYFEDGRKLAAVRAEENIELYLNTHAFGVEKEGDKIRGVVATNVRTGDKYLFEAPLFADCTGDGTIGFLAGADFNMTVGGHMGFSNQWRVVDTGGPVSFPRCPWVLDLSERPFPGRGEPNGWKKLGDWDWESGFSHHPIEKGEYIRDLNLRAMYGAWDALKNVDKVYPNHKLQWAAFIAGKRESRRLMGDIVLSKDDLMRHRRYEDGCVPTSWDMDLHLPAPQYKAGHGKNAFISKDYHTQYKRPYWVPYRCLYSRNISNLFMAGRDISVTHEALGSVRVMRTTGMMGEVVGMAASVCKEHDTNPRMVYENHLAELRELMKQGVGKRFRAKELVLFDFESGFDANQIKAVNSNAAVTGDAVLRVETGQSGGVELSPENGTWDVSSYSKVFADVKNMGLEAVCVVLMAGNEGGTTWSRSSITGTVLQRGEEKTVWVYLKQGPWRFDKPIELNGMRGAPGDMAGLDATNRLDASKVSAISIVVRTGTEVGLIEIDNVRAGGELVELSSDTFIPFIDRFGQFAHGDWPGKAHGEVDMQVRKLEEWVELSAKPGPQEWDEFGGWKKGPTLKATGFFRVEKCLGKWWLVDPHGCLFWSHGIDCVRSRNETPISDREKYFKWLPGENSVFAPFYGTGTWAPHGFYKDKGEYRTYDFSRANFLRKYGVDWVNQFTDITHLRLRSWGINTIANWSEEEIYLVRRTPYVATINFEAKRLEGSEGYWGKFYDVFDESFRENLARRLEQEKSKSAGDAWCVGFFVHNELAWGDEVSLALATLASPAEQPAKKVFVEELKAKYGTIDNLNDAWGVNYASWGEILEQVQFPKEEDKWAKGKTYADLTAFYTKTAETYFATVREEVKRVAPEQLYLGCRFAWVNDLAAKAAAKYCDVVGYNRYDYGVEHLAVPDGIDKPIIIGEFHFGALDRGLFHTGLKPTLSQAERAAAYKHYVKGALRNRYLVGTHWFQYKDQATTGRGDGENYQIGFIDICDTPYAEMIEVSRQIGYNLYEYRLEH